MLGVLVDPERPMQRFGELFGVHSTRYLGP